MTINDLEEKDKRIRFRGKYVKAEKLGRRVKRRPSALVIISGNLLVIFLLLVLFIGLSS